jgi:peptide-methionine (S)-S-oxide reductase
VRTYAVPIITILILSVFAPVPALAQEKTAKATFAGGCYWCVEEVYDGLKGVISATSGFAAPRVEAVEIMYEPDKISYEKLLELFWKNIDPTDSQGQFCDRGAEYTSAIFYHDEQQKTLAEKSKAKIEAILKQKVVTPILPAAKFTPVAAGQQDFYKKNKQQYKQYKIQCGRERRLRELWGSKQSLKPNEDR